MKWPESWKVVCGAARTMSLSRGSSECRKAGPLMAAMIGTSMLSKLPSRCLPSQ